MSDNNNTINHHIKPIAFYLPQFHPIPENDAWWGEGFTEWTNVKKARPLFSGHYQPHVPHRDIGYYDLRDVEVQKKQAQLAKAHGIYGFCYYHYWFSGKRLLERPLNNILQHPEIDFPFCICWANENWTRRWDGDDKKVLIAQEHNANDDEHFIMDCLPIFQDPRYIHFDDGVPMILIYRPGLLPDAKRTMRVWRKTARRAGFKDLHIVRVENFDRHIPPREYGCDAAVKFAPNFDVIADIEKVQERPLVGNYDALIAEDLADAAPAYTLYKCVTPSWDNAARRQDRGGVTFINSDPEKFFRWFRNVMIYTYTRFHGDSRYMFINAWNEWGEGAHMEPDEKYGYGWLNAAKNALRREIREEDIQAYHFDANIAATLRRAIINVCGSLKKDLDKAYSDIRTQGVLERRLQRELRAAREELQRTQATIRHMESSRFWKLRAWNDKVKFGVFHPVRCLRKHLFARTAGGDDDNVPSRGM